MKKEKKIKIVLILVTFFICCFYLKIESACPPKANVEVDHSKGTITVSSGDNGTSESKCPGFKKGIFRINAYAEVLDEIEDFEKQNQHDCKEKLSLNTFFNMYYPYNKYRYTMLNKLTTDDYKSNRMIKIKSEKTKNECESELTLSKVNTITEYNSFSDLNGVEFKQSIDVEALIPENGGLSVTGLNLVLECSFLGVKKKLVFRNMSSYNIRLKDFTNILSINNNSLATLELVNVGVNTGIKIKNDNIYIYRRNTPAIK